MYYVLCILGGAIIGAIAFYLMLRNNKDIKDKVDDIVDKLDEIT